MALPLDATPTPKPYGLAQARIRRCTFRRLTLVRVDGEEVYDVTCLFPERQRPIPLGDLETASPVCNTCTAPHIFRADED